ncbi:phospholipase D-like domain-containing protein [Virgifigura deserti]|uniref:phospholipase D-like domain-containing protein n=1 Tax=Virgifigura deserti TaxID=2268457 RepID=UPI003CCB858B
MAPARHATVLIDAASYFAHLEQAFRHAKRSILIIGWDFDGHITLRPDSEDEDVARTRLSDLFLSLVQSRPELEIRILVWDFSVFYGPGAPLPLLLGADWQEHSRIHLRLDNKHPLYGAHHQKLVCIDDALAFAGGIDLTVRRWDTDRHAADDPARVDSDGTPYNPVHDLQMAVDGEAARALADLARERWHMATGEALAPVSLSEDPWPPSLAADFVDVPVAIARTEPAWGREPAICEAATLTADALAAAQRWIYIEAQYLTATAVGDLLAERLAAAEGPEIVVLATRNSQGWVERFIMGSNRDRLIRRLKQVDGFDRLRVYYPVIPSAQGEREVLIHSKLIITDDAFLRVGSSNLNNRSVGLDSECDLAIEAETDVAGQAIARLRERLLAEHLGTSPEMVAQAITAEGSLIRAIERLNRNPRGLRPFAAQAEDGPTTPFPGTDLFDPEEPFEPLRLLRGRRDG